MNEQLDKIFGPISPDRPKCDFTHCFYGMGLVGQGRCPGDPNNPECLEYRGEGEWVKTWKNEEVEP